MQNSKNTFIYVLNITLRLVAVCAIIALLVAVVNYFAAPVIDANNEKATQSAIKTLFGGADIVPSEIETVISPENEGIIDTVYKVSSADGSTLGYCVSLSPAGFKGEVNLIAAFDKDGLSTGVEITATNDETSGIGTKIKNKSFTDLFIESEENPLSDSADSYIISGATKTSKPVSEAIIAAKAHVLSIISENDNSDVQNGGEVSE